MSEHFSISELTFSETAVRNGIDNRPTDPIILANLEFLGNQLEKVRGVLGNKPMRITSGYRCDYLNELRNGALGSQHTKGMAVDFRCSGFGSPYEIALELSKWADRLRFDQLILEYDSWVHISFDPARSRREILTKRAGRPYEQGIIRT